MQLQAHRYMLSIFLLFFFSLGMFAQQLTVTGVVKDATGEAVIGASVLVKGTTNGTITDFDGNFTLSNVPGDAIIEITFVGYLPQSVKATSAPISVTLKEDTQALDEVVVVGYGVQKKSVVTASIAKVGSESLAQTAPTRVDNALRGLASGVQVIAADGQPGSGARIRVRGIGTINDSDPLYIVDGMALNGGIDNIDPADIESIEVLKDAASGAVYGARAANGVILVTTKKGKQGKAQVSYNASFGWQSAWRKRDMLNATEYATLMNEAAAYAGQDPLYANPSSLGEGTDWQDVIFNNGAPVQNHQLSLSGATERVNYYFSMGYLNQEGIIGGDYDASNYERLSFRSNTEYTVFDESKNRNWLKSMKFTLNASYTRINSRGITAGSLTGSVLADALFMDPTMSVYADSEDQLQSYDRDIYGEPIYDKKTGQLLAMPSSNFNELANPLARLSRNQNNKNNSDKVIANMALDFNIWDNLHYKFSWGSDLAFWGSDNWWEPYYLNANARSDQSGVSSSMNRGYQWQIENVLTYDKTFGQHSFNIVLGQSALRATSRYLSGTRYDLPEYRDDMANIDFATGLATDGRMTVGGSAGDPHSLASYFGRLSYNYAERYMLQATVRRDGSSRFGSNNKWATFPSISLGWNLTNEPFMERRPDWLTNTKIRLSWGKNGNESIGNFKYTVYTATGNNYPFGAGPEFEKLVLGSKATGTPNADLKWEESEQTDFGIDFGFFNNSLTLSVDYFIKKTNGMLKEMPVPSYLGESKPIANVGSMENSGLEVELGYKLHKGEFDFGTSLNLSYIKNKLTNLGNADGFESMANVHQIGNVGRAENGQPYPFFYGWSTDGIIQNQAEADAYNSKYGQSAVPGDVRFVDYNGDGQLTDDDMHNIGNGYPKVTFGWNFNASYKNFDFSMLISGALGGKIADVTRRLDCAYVNLPAEFINRWHGEGTSNTMPRFTFPGNDGNRNWGRFSDLYIHNGDYARIKNIQLGYTLPASLTHKFFVSRLRVYVSAENLLTFTGYKGLDPELANDALPGIDRGYYPQSRTYTVGFNLNF
ncbi:MAG: TonB-dependent receptor [Bacteroidales bacterium]|nr:TonB-dependent receptor [Bacteroidales bacterium]